MDGWPRPPRTPARAPHRSPSVAHSYLWGIGAVMSTRMLNAVPVIKGHQRSSEVIRGHQRSSEVIRGHQKSSEVAHLPTHPVRSADGSSASKSLSIASAAAPATAPISPLSPVATPGAAPAAQVTNARIRQRISCVASSAADRESMSVLRDGRWTRRQHATGPGLACELQRRNQSAIRAQSERNQSAIRLRFTSSSSKRAALLR